MQKYVDFTLRRYHLLLDALSNNGYAFQTFSDFLSSPKERVVILRHDVDDKYKNSLAFASIQYQRGIKGSYYFRMVPASFHQKTLQEIAEMGHEVGYHYETMDSSMGDIDKAYDEFCRNLEFFRKIVPVKTICMHGSPRSPFDNRALWKKYDYKKSGIFGEPYYDIDFTKVAYLTDTGRKWNGTGVSIRDKVDSPFKFNFKSTLQIIRQVNTLPDQVMFTFHPQRWTNHPFQWIQEFILQNIKNQVKKVIISRA